MDMMELRRMVMSQMANSGKLPTGMSLDNITVSQTATIHTLSHSLGETPDMFMLISKNDPGGNGNSYPYFYVGFSKSSSGNEDYPYRLMENHTSSNGLWDYTLTNMACEIDSQQIKLSLPASQRLPVGDYYLITYKFQ